MTEDTPLEYEFIKHEYKVNKPNGDIDFIEVADLPEQVALKWVHKLYPSSQVELFRTTLKNNQP